MKKILSFIICMVLTLTIFNQTNVVAQPTQIPITVNVNGQAINFSKYGAYPIIENGTTMLPFRSIFEQFNGYIDTDYYNIDKTIRFYKSKGMMNYTLVLDEITQSITLLSDGLTDDGKVITKEFTIQNVPIVNIDGRIFVPLRAISETLGYEVLWNGNTKTIDIDATAIQIDYPEDTKIITDELLNAIDYPKEVCDLVNLERQNEGLKPLTLDPTLNSLAQEKAEDMVKNNYFDHTSPTYGSPFDMMKQYGINFSAAGENIAFGQITSNDVMDSWMNSKGHRENILNKNFENIGIGMTQDSNGRKYWVQMFATY